MAYAHYFRRVPILDQEAFVLAGQDIRQIIDKAKALGIKIAGPTGRNVPELSDITIAFNGYRDCGHRYIDLGDPWPSKLAEGIDDGSDPVIGPWFSGAMLRTRACGGSCAQEPFVLDRRHQPRAWEQMERGMYYAKCETRFKPYDLIVTASLVRLKERLGDQIQLWSDGLERAFEEAKQFCRPMFGWPEKFDLDPGIGDREERETTEVV